AMLASRRTARFALSGAGKQTALQTVGDSATSGGRGFRTREARRMEASRPDSASAEALDTRLERGALVYLPVCPFPLPAEEDRSFLFAQTLSSSVHKNISFDPVTQRVSGFAVRAAEQAAHLRDVLADFAQHCSAWLAQALPGYARACRPDRVSFRPEEEATRRLRYKARNDLLHI